MSEIAADMSVQDIKAMIFRLPAQELMILADSILERADTAGMMQLAETGFQEWNEEGEDIYDGEA